MELVGQLSNGCRIYHPTGNLNYLEAAKVSDEAQLDRNKINLLPPEIRMTNITKWRRIWKWLRYLDRPAKWYKSDIYTSALVCQSGDILDIRFMSESKRFRVYGELIGVSGGD